MMKRWRNGGGWRMMRSDSLRNIERELPPHTGRTKGVKYLGTYLNAALPSLWYNIAFSSPDWQRGCMLVLRVNCCLTQSLYIFVHTFICLVLSWFALFSHCLHSLTFFFFFKVCNIRNEWEVWPNCHHEAILSCRFCLNVLFLFPGVFQSLLQLSKNSIFSVFVRSEK